MISLVLVLVWKSDGYYVLLVMADLQTVPVSIYEAKEPILQNSESIPNYRT